MARSFNTAGPCRAEDDYMVPRSARLPGVRALIDGKKSFVVHAPRRSGEPFTAEAVERAFALTQGQPRLVNALARQAVARTNRGGSRCAR